MARAARYPHNMSQVLPHLNRSRKARLVKIGLRAASDLNGRKTYLRLLREVPATPRSSAAEAANQVTAAMTPKR